MKTRNQDIKISETFFATSMIQFGRYWAETGMKDIPIDWIILEETTDHYFIVSKQAIVSKMFGYGMNDWSGSDIRTWLNHEFMEAAFDYYERSCLIDKEITTTNDPYLTWGGKSRTPMIKSVESNDKVFLLSTHEVEKYFKEKESRIVEFSQYAVDTLGDNTDLLGVWWLRNEEELGWGPMSILSDGSYDGEYKSSDDNPIILAGVRPAIYIKKAYFERIPHPDQMHLFDK